MTAILWSQLVWYRWPRKVLAVLALCLAPGLVAPGCAAGPPAPRQLVGPGPVGFLADWDDLDAAMDVAAERSEMALVSISEPGGDGLSRRYQLRTVAAEPVEVIVTRPEPDPAAPDEPQRLTVRAEVGRFGSPQRESLLLSYLKERLEALRGVDYRGL